jgi:hypothetical protein
MNNTNGSTEYYEAAIPDKGTLPNRVIVDTLDEVFEFLRNNRKDMDFKVCHVTKTDITDKLKEAKSLKGRF